MRQRNKERTWLVLGMEEEKFIIEMRESIGRGRVQSGCDQTELEHVGSRQGRRENWGIRSSQGDKRYKGGR